MMCSNKHEDSCELPVVLHSIKIESYRVQQHSLSSGQVIDCYHDNTVHTRGDACFVSKLSA
jgi:hypothetical protein